MICKVRRLEHLARHLWAPEAGEDSVIKMTGVGIECVGDISQTDAIDGKEFRPATAGDALDLDAVREAIVQMAGDHAEDILAALDTATEEDEDQDDQDQG